MHAVIAVNTKLDLAAKCFPEGFVLFAVVHQHGVQFVLDLLFQAVADQLYLAVLLQRFTADVQAQVLAVHNALDKAEVIRQQVSAFFHDHNAGSIQGQTLFVLLGVVIIRRLAGHKQQGGVGCGALGAAGNHAQRVGIIHELALVELVVFFRLYIFLVALPDGHHAVQGFQLGVGFVLRLIVVTGVLRLRLLAALLAVHGNGVADVIAVLLDQAGDGVLVQIFAVFVGFGVLFQHQGDLGANFRLFGFGQGVSLHAGGRPLPGFLAALRAGNNGHLAGNHESGVEANAELTDDVNILVLIACLKVLAAGAGNGAKVLFQLILSHANAVIADGQGAVLFIGCNMNVQVFFFYVDGGVRQALEIQLVAGIRCVGNQLAQEDLAVGINRIDHQVKQLFALGLKLMHCHSYNDLTFIYFMV